MARLNIFSRIFFLCIFTVSPLYAQELCEPVMDGAIINIAVECFNDSTAFIVDSNATDEHGWQYSLDNNMDGVNGGNVGGNVYEQYGIAFLEKQETLCIVVNGNMAIDGVENKRAKDNNVGWGDLFVNLTGNSFLPTSDALELYGIRFADTNDSLAPEAGVYNNVMATSVTNVNSGFKHWKAYANHVKNKGKTPELGEFGEDQTYIDELISHNVIKEGDYTGDVQILTEAELADLNFDNSFYEGTYNIGFCVSKWNFKDPCGVEGGDGSECEDCNGKYCTAGTLKKGGDEDKDGTKNCDEECPYDPLKTEEGLCGCGVSDVDTDNDNTPDCNDNCPTDENKVDPGICGCGESDVDSDFDGTADCDDLCPIDPNKIEPGTCGCGVADTDTDGDGIPDCNDNCPTDANKLDAGICGCGVSDVDTDGDGIADCDDLCPADGGKTDPGVCGCGMTDTDSDGDGVADCDDLCPSDPLKTEPGNCGCGNTEEFCKELDCGDGFIQEGEQCDDGNFEVNDGCSFCELDENLIAEAVCDFEDSFDLQAQLDGYAKRLDKVARREARNTTRLARGRGVNLNNWRKRMVELTGFYEETAWTSIWRPESISYSCNAQGEKLCEVVTYDVYLETYRTNMDLLFKTSRKIARRLKRELRLAGLKFGPFKKFRRKINRFERNVAKFLPDMPEQTLKCPDSII